MLARAVMLCLFVAVAGCSNEGGEGIRSLKRVDPAEAERIQLDRLAQANRQLEVDIERLRKAPAEAADCPPGMVSVNREGHLVLPPGGPVPGPAPGFKVEGLPPAASGPQAEKSEPGMRPEAPAKDASKEATREAPKDGSPLAAMTGPELAKKLEQATALVLTERATGTGFFINDKLLVTNRHVVATAASSTVFVTSRTLGMKRRATVLRVTPASGTGGPDFALVRLDDGSGPGFLGIGTQIEKLAGVVAAGYPALAVKADPDFARLMAGDGTAAPDLNFTQGAVQSLTQQPAGMSLILHTASLLKGNSGGPLVDMCGRVVGVNTFITLDEKQAGRLSYSLGADGLLAFLKDTAGAAQGDARSCPR